MTCESSHSCQIRPTFGFRRISTRCKSLYENQHADSEKRTIESVPCSSAAKEPNCVSLAAVQTCLNVLSIEQLQCLHTRLSYVPVLRAQASPGHALVYRFGNRQQQDPHCGLKSNARRDRGGCCPPQDSLEVREVRVNHGQRRVRSPTLISDQRWRLPHRRAFSVLPFLQELREDCVRFLLSFT